jgi:membrane fusion protein, multidrug efflux system
MRNSLLGLLMLAMGALLGAYFGPKMKSPAANKPLAPVQSKISEPRELELSTTDVYKLGSGAIESSIALTGSIKAANQTVVKSKTSGELQSILVREGDAVKKGQILAQMDSVELDLRLKEREAQVRSAAAQAEQSKRSYDNNKALVDKNFISTTALENSRAQWDAAQSNLDAAKANLALARKALVDAKIVAPLSGVVGERFAQTGEKLSPDNRILSIIDLSRMEAEFQVPAPDIGALRLGQEVMVHVESYPSPVKGRVVRLSPSTLNGARSLPIYVNLESPGRPLNVGLFAQTRLPVARRESALLIPVSALREKGANTVVYVLENGQISEKLVKLGLRDDNLKLANGASGAAEVLQGLKAGDQVIAMNLGVLESGRKARLTNN